MSGSNPFPAAYMITVMGTAYFSSWLHKWLLKVKSNPCFWQMQHNFTCSEGLRKLGKE